MIYTKDLCRGTKHIMVYDGNTPVDIINIVHYHEDSEEEWISRVQKLLERYAVRFGIELSSLSAKPVNVKGEWEI
jgi:hypothetical protein